MSAKAPALSASRIANATRVAQAADDTGVTGWLKTAPFIVAAQLDETAGPWTAVYKIQWRAVGGTFADLAATGALKYTTATDLVNGNAVTSGEAICTNNPGGAWKDGEEVEGTGTADSIVLADEDYTEIHVAVDPADAAYSTEYEFQIYDVTTGAAVGTCLATVTIDAEPWTPIGVMVDIDHEAGNVAEWTDVYGSGPPTATTGAALVGTYGLNIPVTGAVSTYGWIAFTGGYSTVRVRYYFDANSLSVDTAGDGHNSAAFRNASGANLADVYHNYGATTGQTIRLTLQDDALADQIGTQTDLTDEPHYIEFVVYRATTSSASDGSGELWVDGVSVDTVTGVDNYDSFITTTGLRIGLTGANANTTGTVYCDDVIVRDDDTLIGPVGGATQQPLAGAMTSAGTLSLKTKKILAGAMTSAGAVSTPVGIVLDIDHEAGTLAEWDTDTSPGIAATVAAALGGSSYGMAVDVTGAVDESADVALSFGPDVFRFRFYYDPNSISINSAGDEHQLVTVRADTATVLRVDQNYDATYGQRIHLALVNDAASGSSTTYYDLTDEPHYIEVVCYRATTDTAADGNGEIWIDGVSRGTVTAVDNYDVFALIDTLRMGCRNADATTAGTVYFDELIFRDDDYKIGPALQGIVLDIDHEAGTLAEWTSTSGDGISATVAAALASTSYGMAVILTNSDTTADYAIANVQVGAAGTLRYRFYFDVNSLTMTDNDDLFMGGIYTDATYSAIDIILQAQLKATATGYEIQLQSTNDADADTGTGFATLSDVPHYIEISYVSESSDGAADGTIDWWIDGVEQTGLALTGIENWNVFQTIDEFRMGSFWRTGTTVNGTIYLDEIVLRDDDTLIGPVGGATQQPLAGAMTSAGTLSLKTKKILAGAMTSAGAVSTSVGTGVNQTFRIRSDDTQTLNETTTGWAGAIGADATINVMQAFRIRWEIEETAGTTFNSALKVQYSKNGGTWTDCTYYLAGTTTVPSNWIILSGQYVDLDATTDVLSNSTETFVAGDGNEDPAIAAVSLNNQHTEHETCHMIPTFFDGAGHNVDTDYFDFRLVETDGTILTGTYDNPRITINVPDYHIGGTAIESMGRGGPLLDADGNMYYACEPSESDPLVMMLKSSDGGKIWTEMDGANRPTATDFESSEMVYVNNVIHLVHEDGGAAYYYQFNTASNGTTPDTWTIEETVTTGYTNTDQCGALQVRSDGTVVLFYRKTVTNEGIYYKIRSTVPAWGSEVELDTTASTEFVAVMIVKGASDKIHCFYKDETNINILHKSLNSSDSLSAVETVYTDAGTHGPGINWGMTNAVYWDDAGDEKVMVAVHDDSDDFLYSVVITNDGSPETPKLIDNVTVANNEATFNGRQPIAFLAVDPATDTIYCYYTDLTTFDIWKVENVNDGTWEATATEMHDGVICDVIRGNVFTHSAGNGGKKVIGYIYEDDSNGYTGYGWYSEYELAGLFYQSTAGTLTSSGSLVKKAKKLIAGATTSAGALIKKSYEALVGAMTSSGVLSTLATFKRTLDGALSSSGTVVIKSLFYRTLTGAMTSSGDILRKIAKLLSGDMASSGVVSLKSRFTKALSGAMDSSGDILRKIYKSFAGSMDSAGEIYKKVIIALSGAMSSDGALSKKMREFLEGVLTSSGTVSLKSRFTKALSGAMTSAGTIVKKIILSFSGAMTPTGNLVKNTKKLLSGILTSSGVVDGIKQAGIYYQSISGAMTSGGVLSTLATFRESLAGVLTSSGDVSRTASFFRTLAGSMASSGIVSTLSTFRLSLSGIFSSDGVLTTIRTFRTSLAGSMDSAGILTKNIKKLLSGAMTNSGTLAKKMWITLVGVMDSSGILSGIKLGNTYYQSISGAMTSDGVVTTLITFRKSLAGVLSSDGAVAKGMFLALSGATASSGAVIKKVSKILAGAMASSGDVYTKFKKYLTGALTSTGSITRKIFKALTGALTSVGDLAAILIGVSLYYKSIAGSMGSTGTLSKTSKKLLDGILTSVGVLATRGLFYRLLEGVLTSSGVVSLKTLYHRVLSGSMASTGAIYKKISIILAGFMSSSGDILRKIFKILSGDMDSSGLLSATRRFIKSLVGGMTSSGDILRKIKLLLFGSMASGGTIRKKISKLLTGVMTSIGSLIALLEGIFVDVTWIIIIEDSSPYVITIIDE